MRFWDSSGLVPLLLGERSTSAMQAAYDEDPEVVTWWGTLVECASALARLERQNRVGSSAAADASERLARFRRIWHEIEPHEEIRESAIRLLRVHDLRAADALQLGAAFVAADRRPSTLPFVALDRRLLKAARLEGFPVLLAR